MIVSPQSSVLVAKRWTAHFDSSISCIVTSPVTPPKSSREPDESEESGSPEEHNEEDDGDCGDDDIIILSRRPPSSSLKHDRRTGNGTRSLRRRPFLIFDRTEAKGYKQLNHRPQPDISPLPPSYRPGDGFSGREAKPNGSNFLTRNGKQSANTGPHVGILDLTQSEPPPENKKRRARRANFDDNSFMPPQKKPRQPRHALEPKDPNQQPKRIAEAPNQEKKTNTAHLETNNTPAELKIQEAAAALVKENDPPQDHSLTTNPTRSPDPATGTDSIPDPTITPRMVSNQDAAPQVPAPHNNEEVGMISIIERSDDLPHEPSGVSEEADGHDSCEAQISSSPPRRLTTRALSASPRSRSRRVGASEGRDFRRVNTQ